MLRGFARRKQETFQMTVPGLEAPVTIRRSARARRLTLSVNEARRTGVLTVPLNTTLEQAGDFLSRHFDWLRDKVAQMPEAIPFTDGTVMPLRGLEHRLRFVGPARRRGAVWTDTQEQEIESAVDWSGSDAHAAPALPAICVAGDAQHAPRRLKDWLIREARKDLTARSHWHAKNLEVKPKRIAVRDQTTRWGSCSATGALSYSWRVILAPPFVLDYLAAHEVAHLKEMNHSKHFWALVRETMPRMEEGRRWLRAHGNDLHSFGADI